MYDCLFVNHAHTTCLCTCCPKHAVADGAGPLATRPIPSGKSWKQFICLLPTLPCTQPLPLVTQEANQISTRTPATSTAAARTQGQTRKNPRSTHLTSDPRPPCTPRSKEACSKKTHMSADTPSEIQGIFREPSTNLQHPNKPLSMCTWPRGSGNPKRLRHATT